MKPQYIVGIGEALWDMLPQGRQIGGAPANFAYHVSQFGLPVRVVSAVGSDALGKEILQIFSQRQIPALVSETDQPTGTVQVSLDDNGVPVYGICTGVAWDFISFTPQLESLARQTRAVCFGSLAQRSDVSRETIHRFLDAMPSDEDVLKVFDINLRQQFYTSEVLHSSLRKCNILKINDEELAVVARLWNFEEQPQEGQARRLLRDYGLKLVILTCGENGSYVFTPDKTSFEPTPEVSVVDTVGAGDAFTAAFIASLLKGQSVIEAHRCAVHVSAYVCTQSGAMPKYVPTALLHGLS